MKTAVLMCGQMRTFARTLLNQHWFVYRKLTNPAFFISAVDDGDADSTERLSATYPANLVCVELVTQPTLPEPDKEWGLAAPYFDDPKKYGTVSMEQGYMRGFWHLNRVWEFFKECTAPDNGYSRFVLMRSDAHFHGWEPPAEPVGPKDAVLPWWGNYGGVNGTSGVFGAVAMEVYATTFTRIDALIDAGCPFHPESLVAASLERAGCRVRRCLSSEFGIMRKDRFDDFKIQPQELARYTAALVGIELRKKQK